MPSLMTRSQRGCPGALATTAFPTCRRGLVGTQAARISTLSMFAQATHTRHVPIMPHACTPSARVGPPLASLL